MVVLQYLIVSWGVAILDEFDVSTLSYRKPSSIACFRCLMRKTCVFIWKIAGKYYAIDWPFWRKRLWMKAI